MNGFSGNKWRIELQCPQCGGPVDLDETDRVFSCGFCRVRLFIDHPGKPRYFLPCREPAHESLIFVPYWRMRGISFRCVGMDIEHRVTEASLLALKSTLLPPSLGLRPQTLKARFVTPESAGTFAEADLPPKIVTGDAWKVVDAIEDDEDFPKVEHHQAFIGDSVSLVYAPVYIQGKSVFDGVLNRAVAGIPPGEPVEIPHRVAEKPRIGFLPMICPGCGWDLEGDHDTLVPVCRNCDSVWRPVDGGFKRFDHWVGSGGDKDSLYLPFWKIAADVTGVTLKTHADLARLANLPRRIEREWESMEALFWVPAFKAAPNLYLRLARFMTLTRFDCKTREELRGLQLYPVTLPLAEAVKSLVTVIATFAVPRKIVYPRLGQVQARPVSARLCYLPFTPRGAEVVQTQANFSISMAALNHGRQI